MRLLPFLTLVATSSMPFSTGQSTPLTYTALTKPLPLYPGEVTNTWHVLDIPKGPIAISEFAADVVERDPATGELIPVPLADAYLHHHLVRGIDATRVIGFGAGTESRGTKQKFPYPYRYTTNEGENALLANVHVINTRDMPVDDAHHCLECPCTSQDLVHEDGIVTTTLLESVAQRKPSWDTCNDALVEEENTSCSPDSYHGGIFCCEDGEFCLDKYYMSEDSIAKASNVTQSVFYLRYTISYEPVTQEVRPLYLSACCDATGDNTEYDIPKCTGDEDECVHELENVQTLHGLGVGFVDKEDPYLYVDEEDKYVDVVFMVGHLHRGGKSVTLYLEDGTVLCESLPTYGTGEAGEIGNEPGYINSMTSCTFDPPLRMKTTDKLRIVGKYDSTEAHTGVMSLFYIAIADIDHPVDGVADGVAPPVVEPVGPADGVVSKSLSEAIGSFAVPLAIVAVVGIFLGVSFRLVPMISRRFYYNTIPNDEVIEQHV